MSTMYSKASTALLFVDPYNDFLADGGKLWPMVSEVAGNVRLHDNLRAILARTRELDWTICVVPHHRAEPDEMANWKRATPYQRGAEAAPRRRRRRPNALRRRR
jgi:nicotinamidase-related amidase